MKKLYYSSAVLLASLLSFAGCSSDDVAGKSDTDGKLITVNTAIGNGAESRVAYDDKGSTEGMTVAWSNNETFKMYRGTSSDGSDFTKSAAGSVFSGTAPSETSGTYYCVYPKDIVNNAGDLTIDLSSQTGTSAENGIKEFMLASSDALNKTLTFEHKLTVLKLTLTLPDDVTGTASQVTVSGMHNKATYTLSTSAYAYGNDKGTITATNNDQGFPIENKKITAYVSVFPETVTANSVTITATVGSSDYAYKLTGANTLVAGRLIPVTQTLALVSKQNAKTTYTIADYFQWDAYSYVTNGSNIFSEGDYGYNTTTNANDVASHSCKDCPTASQMVAYLKAGVYWDDNTTVTEGQQTYSAPNGTDGIKTNQHTGLWIKKKAKIETFDTETVAYYTTTSETFKTLSTQTDDFVKTIRTSGDYFFLPAAGGYNADSFSGAGSVGLYWSSTPTSMGLITNFLNFGSGGAGVQGTDRGSGFLPWCAE